MALTYRGQLDRPLTQEEIDANFAYFTGSHSITGSLGISGSIIPAVGVGQTTSSFSLGSETAAWKDIYVSEGSIKFIASGSPAVTLSAKDGGISVNGGSTISADGIDGQFFTSKSLYKTQGSLCITLKMGKKLSTFIGDSTYTRAPFNYRSPLRSNNVCMCNKCRQELDL